MRDSEEGEGARGARGASALVVDGGNTVNVSLGPLESTFGGIHVRELRRRKRSSSSSSLLIPNYGGIAWYQITPRKLPRQGESDTKSDTLFRDRIGSGYQQNCVSLEMKRTSGDCQKSISGAEGDRTPNLVIANHALSQLSYGPIRHVVGVIIAPLSSSTRATARSKRRGEVSGEPSPVRGRARMRPLTASRASSGAG